MFSGPGGFLARATKTSLIGNTDDVVLIHSSSYGVWPVFLVINELSPLINSLTLLVTMYTSQVASNSYLSYCI